MSDTAVLLAFELIACSMGAAGLVWCYFQQREIEKLQAKTGNG